MSEIFSHGDSVDRALDAALHAICEQEDRGMTEHPSPEDLVAYQEKRLKEAVEQKVRHHLTHCEGCARDLLALEEFDFDQADPSLFPSTSEITEDLETFQELVAQESENPRSLRDNLSKKAFVGLPGSGDAPSVSAPKRRSDALALAASIVLALGLGYWISSTVHSSAPAGRAGSNPLLVDLAPDGTRSIRDASSGREVLLPGGMDSLLLRLNLGDQQPYPSYRAEVLDETGEVRFRQENLRKQPTGEFLLWVGREGLSAGLYTIRLSGLGSDDTTILATYRFHLRDAPDE